MTNTIEPTAASLINAGTAGGVFKRGANAFTTSTAIAKHFGKRHGNVLRDIDRILEILPEQELDFEFELSPVPTGNGGTREVRVCHMNRRATALLVMGWTTAKALRWKVAFLDAFDILVSEHHRRDQWDVTAEMGKKVTPANKGWAKIQAMKKAEAARLRYHRAKADPRGGY